MPSSDWGLSYLTYIFINDLSLNKNYICSMIQRSLETIVLRLNGLANLFRDHHFQLWYLTQRRNYADSYKDYNRFNSITNYYSNVVYKKNYLLPILNTAVFLHGECIENTFLSRLQGNCNYHYRNNFQYLKKIQNEKVY